MKRLAIAVNTRLLLKNKLEGIGWFTFETLKRICVRHPEVDFYFLFDRRPDPEFIFAPNVIPKVVFPQARHPLLFYIWFNISLPRVLKKIRPGLFLSPDGYNSIPFKGKSLLVIHDLNFEHYPKDLPFLVRLYYRYFTPRFARKATRIATVSEFSRQDISQTYQLHPSGIDVVYDGVNEFFHPVNEETADATRKVYTAGRPYFIFIGALHPRKNLVNLFKAFDLFKENDTRDCCLLIAGEKKYWTPAIRDAYSGMKFRNDVVFTGRLKVKEVNDLIGSSVALLYVSYFEGFGIPILEAFACHTPVITSNCSSMPEIASGAALLVDPFVPASISAAMQQVCDSPEVRANLIALGQARLPEFSWDRTATLLWESIEKTLRS